MTDKQINILNAALELFANEGYNAVSTSKIARKAGVSEGLIFRHFTNKKGLLEAIVQEAETRIQQVFAPVLFENDPNNVFPKLIDLVFDTDKSQYDFWKLQYKLKWESEYNNPGKMKPVFDKLSKTFAALGKEHPAMEAWMLLGIIDQVAIQQIRGELDQPERYRKFLLDQYST